MKAEETTNSSGAALLAPIAIPTGWSVAEVHVYTGCGHWKYTLTKAIKEGHIIPVNVSTHRYEVVHKPNQTVRLVIEPVPMKSNNRKET